MNKVISFILLCAVLLTCLTGCAVIDQLWASPTEPAVPTDPTLPTKPPVEYNNPMDLPVELLDALVDYLDTLNEEYSRLPISNQKKIDLIKNREQAFCVSFDPLNCYYVCGYLNIAHKYSEVPHYCCAEKYVWVAFENASEIQEYYNDAKIAVAFQLNKTLTIENAVDPKGNVPVVEHFQLYAPKFADGLNVNKQINFNEVFIYRNVLGQSTLYITNSRCNHEDLSFPCIYLEDTYYITIFLYRVDSDGYRHDGGGASAFGKYSEMVENAMITDKHSVTNENGTDYYGLLSISNFRKIITE